MSFGTPVDAPGTGVTSRDRRIESTALLVLAALVGWFYVWSALQPGDSWLLSFKNPAGYYPLETAGFRSGHLYAALTPHPALLALPDPYDPVANAPYRAHDMSLYQGHYYLYFGVTPVLVLFWPVAALTGRYLTEPFAVALFCTGAIWVGMGLLLAIRRRHFPGAPFLALVAAWLCLAWATPLSLLVVGPQFYQVPISCAIFLQALMFAAVYASLHSERRALLWMGAAGLLFGLSIGARPNYLVSFIVLLVPAVSFARTRAANSERKTAALARALLATFLPTLACGIGLLVYNWARFGSPSEFGMHYQLAGERVATKTVVAARFMLPHIRFYLFNPGDWASYFPFFSAAGGQPYGLLRYVPWAWLGVFAFVRPKAEGRGEQDGLRPMAWVLAGAFAANLAILACFFGTTARYPGDFANAELILAGVGALSLAQWAGSAGWPWLGRLILIGVAGVSLFFGLTVYVGLLPGKDRFAGLARAANWPLYAVEKATGAGFGGLRLELRLPDKAPVQAEPLLETGKESETRDWLQISYLPQNRARLSFFHAGTGLFPGKEFNIPADRKIAVDIRCGSLLPPFDHPALSGWSRSEYNDVKRDLQVKVDGEEVLRASVDCYDSSPANLTLGRVIWVTGGITQSFSGSILSVKDLPLVKPPKVAPLFNKAEPVELTLFLPAAGRAGADPLLVTGNGGESDLLYCSYDGSARVKFGLDHYGAGGPQSELVTYDPVAPHKVTIWLGSMAGAAAGTAPSGRLVVIFDGKTLLNLQQVFYPSTPESAIVGYNAYNSSEAGREFSGRVAGARQVPVDSLPPLTKDGSYGAVEMSINFPYYRSGTQEPLVLTGVQGAGDLVYVRYVDPSHVMFGFDHWGVGGFLGGPIEIDYGQTHRLKIAFQSLYPPGSPQHESDAVSVTMDGKPALVGKFACHPSSADRIKIGANPIGASTCGPLFSGRILSIERSSQPNE